MICYFWWIGSDYGLYEYVRGVSHPIFNNIFRYVVVFIFDGVGDWSTRWKPNKHPQLSDNFCHIILLSSTFRHGRKNELASLEVIITDWIGRCKSKIVAMIDGLNCDISKRWSINLIVHLFFLIRIFYLSSIVGKRLHLLNVLCWIYQ
jgi:hypothetical protein